MFNRNAKFLIQWDNASKAYPFRVVSISGICLGYFKNRADAEAFAG